MSVDMRLISIKDGGRFAVSWLAGTNPKALRSNAHRTHIYGLDVPDVCKDLMKCIKRKNNAMSFRILFRLCFGTIRIYSEQVQHLYNVTLNFVCFNTFLLKQYSRKRSSSTVGGSESKKRRMGSIDNVDITNLLMETECFDEYSEENFEFPQEISTTREKKITTSTCIRIKEITIRQISWDCPPPAEEDAFGEASQDERNMLLHEMSGREDDLLSQQSSTVQKRKSPGGSNDVPEKRLCLENTPDITLEEVRCAPPSVIDESASEFNIDYRFQSVVDHQTEQDSIGKYVTFDETLSCLQVNLDQSQQCNALPEVSIDLPPQDNEVSTRVPEIPIPVQETKPQTRKRPRSLLITDRFIKLPRIDLDYCRNHIWENCLNPGKKEHIVNTLISTPVTTIHREPTRFPKRLGNFKRSFKTAQMQDAAAENRLLLLEEILGDDLEAFKSEFKLTSRRKSRFNARNQSRGSHFQFEEIPILPVNNLNTENMELNNNNREMDEYTRDNTIPKDTVTLKCFLDQIDPSKIKFKFPNDPDSQRSSWGKEGVLRKLLSLWKTDNLHVSMNTLILGASRINAALAFHTLLDLAGQQYVNIIKDNHNSIKFIHMGPEMIRKINNLCI